MDVLVWWDYWASDRILCHSQPDSIDARRESRAICLDDVCWTILHFKWIDYYYNLFWLWTNGPPHWTIVFVARGQMFKMCLCGCVGCWSETKPWCVFDLFYAVLQLNCNSFQLVAVCVSSNQMPDRKAFGLSCKTNKTKSMCVWVNWHWGWTQNHKHLITISSQRFKCNVRCALIWFLAPKPLRFARSINRRSRKSYNHVDKPKVHFGFVILCDSPLK